MAEQIEIRNSGQVGKIRHPLGVIGLSIITIGIYYIFWYYFVNKELAAIGKAHNTEECGTSPGTSVLAVTLGVFIIVPPFVSIYNSAKRLSAAKRLTGAEPGLEAGLLFVLWIFLSPVAHYIFQSDMNKTLRAQANGGGQIPAAQVAPAPPEQPQPEQPAPPQQPQA